MASNSRSLVGEISPAAEYAQICYREVEFQFLQQTGSHFMLDLIAGNRNQPFRGWVLILANLLGATSAMADGNRLAYLDTVDPYYVSRTFAKLVTPQWADPPRADSSGPRPTTTDAVVVLAIDDMRGYEKWEEFLRPTLDRLKRIDGRAPVSIMTCQLEPFEPHLQTWLDEGVSLEVHTFDHPCPLLKDGDFTKAQSTYERCVDLLARVPNSKPVAFRMPCCDSLNTFSPRFVTEIFNRHTEAGNHLSIDSSVFHVFSVNDPALPRELAWDEAGRQRFRKYLPFPSFVNTIEDYPYPYVIGGRMWEFPCMVPSDWEAQNLQHPNNPATVRDWQVALDATVIKQGVFNLVFHPHNWIRAEQVNELIDHAVKTYGKRVTFLTFREANERLTANLLAGHPLRAADGGDNGVRLLDLNDDGYLDVLIGNDKAQITRVWQPDERQWRETALPVKFVTTADNVRRAAGARFGIVASPTGPAVTLLVADEHTRDAWQFDGSNWIHAPELLRGLEAEGKAIQISSDGRDRGVRMVDLDGDGSCEMLVANDRERAAFRWSMEQQAWVRLPFTPPQPAAFVDARGNDRGLRLVDVDDDARLDVIYSNEEREGLWLYDSFDEGWATRIVDQPRGEKATIPMIVRGETNNGAWFHSRGMWVQNEDTAEMPDLVDRRSFNELVGNIDRGQRPVAVAAQTMKARPGFQVELVAAEPLVSDPVAFDFGPDGRLWVAEMGDYPDGADGQGKPGSRVRALDDSDGDGRLDHSTLFLDGLSHANSVLAWRKGAIVCAPPEIFYAEDTDGDGKADSRQVLYDGFSTWNPQHLENGLKRGLDNWIYCCNGYSEAVRSIKTGQVVNLANKDFRIRPDEGLIEPLSGHCQFIRNRNDWGDWFGNVNSNPMWQYTIDDRYLIRNPHVRVLDVRPDVLDVPGSARVYPASRTLARFNDLHTADCFTSACCAMIYRDTLFGPAFVENSFVSEPVHNLVHREVVRREGIRYRSKRADDEQTSEFFASTDNWSRPTMIDTGPDGALWVADMYRRVIEHTEWIPDSFEAEVDVREGSDQGRIYRVYPVDVEPRRVPNLAKMSPDELVAVLESPNGPQRDLAQQLLVQAKDRSIVPQLEELSKSNAAPQARLHALYTLEGLEALNVDTILSATADEHAELRRHAIRLAEPRLAAGDENANRLLAALVTLSDDDPRVQLQLALTLGESTDPAAGQKLGELALQAQAEPLIAAAVNSSSLPHLGQITEAVTRNMDQTTDPAAALVPLLDSALGVGDFKALTHVLAAVNEPRGGNYADWQLVTVANLIERLASSGRTLESLRSGRSDLSVEVDRLGAIFDHARTTAAADSSPLPAREQALSLLSAESDQQSADLELLASLLAPAAPTTLQLAAIDRLAQLDDQRVPEMLIRQWATYTPSARREVITRMFQRDEWIDALLNAVQNGPIDARDLDASRRQALLSHDNESIRRRAEELLGASVNNNRQQLVVAFSEKLPDSGDATRGRAVFDKRCAVCHLWQESGHAIGPDLAALSDRSTEAMLVAILDPNRAVESRYVSYTAITDGGRTYTGMLADETGGAITLLEQEAKRHVLQRGELEEFTSSRMSLMPEGLEKDISPQDMADVIALLQSAVPKPKDVEGNRPAVVQLEPLRGELACLASNAEIFGKTLRIEEVNGALGWWNSDDDRAAWELEVANAGRYIVLVEFSCNNEAAGNDYAIEAAGQTIQHRVASTGDWNVYHRIDVGALDLPQGRVRLTVRPDGPIRDALMDLKSITLRPEGVN